MLENSRTFSSITQENSVQEKSSIPKYESDREPKMDSFTDDSCKILESAHKSIVDELIDDAILDICFEVHMKEKSPSTSNSALETYRAPETHRTPEKEKVSSTTKPYHQSKSQPIILCCPVCQSIKGTQYFTAHLTEHFDTGAGKRKARQKVFNFEETDDESDDLGSDSEDFKPGSSKRKKKGNKNSRKQSKLPGNSVSRQYSSANLNYQLMSHEEKKAFYDENCGVISKRTRRPCSKTLKCSQHTDEQRKDVREDLLRNMGDQNTNEEEIDVQSIEVQSIEVTSAGDQSIEVTSVGDQSNDEDDSQQFIMPS